MTGAILQVSLSAGGIPKYAVPGALITPLGLEGDRHAHPRIHGGPRQAVLIVCSEGLEELIARGYPLFPGALGENLTTIGLDRRQMRPEQRYRAGQSLLELTKIRVPCSTIQVYGERIGAEIFDDQVKSGNPQSPRWGLSGFYASVIQPGEVRQNDIIALVDQAV
jgi:MOSC domain-containing protein YiiM